MKCPKCSYPNATGVTYCNMCYEVFNKSAADRYLHEQKRARMERDGELPAASASSSEATPSASSSSPSSSSSLSDMTHALHDTLLKVDWEGLFRKLTDTPAHILKKYWKELGVVAAIIGLGVAAALYATPSQRLKIFGSPLLYRIPPNTSLGYFITFGTTVKSWSERDGRLDTPLESFQKDEVGTVKLSAGSLQKNLRVQLKPQEWIVNQAGMVVQNIPLSHPSLKVSQIVLDSQGKIVSRETNPSARLGRVLPFLMPRWPGKAQRVGRQWVEPVEWVESVGDWKILWKGRLQWKIAGFEEQDRRLCARLTYTAQVTPTLRDSPAWAKGAVRGVNYKGTSTGYAYFDVKKRQMYSNVFMQDGTLTIPISNIYRIPPELRVGRMPRRRWGQAGIAPEPGTLVIQLKNTLGVRKS
jgi:hypothetical protein